MIVAGITRSGLTATMQMLNAGGLVCAGEYPAFEPYSIGEIPWEQCKGKVVKLVDAQLQFPPGNGHKVILLKRDRKQQAKSINKFLGAIANLPPMPNKPLVKSLDHDYKIIKKWAKKQNVLHLSFEEIITHPEKVVEDISDFLDFAWPLFDIKKAAEAIVVGRGTDCYPGLLEFKTIKKG